MTLSLQDQIAGPVEESVFRDRMAVLRQRFIDRTRQDARRIAELRGRWEGGEPLTGALLKDMITMMHGLAGAAGIFGFGAISDAAHRVEDLLRTAEAAEIDPGPLLDALAEEMARIQTDVSVS